ncbi:MAG: triose-phosphate isomerase [Candidatus Sungbacteria bacterium]|nr:triose-phosphate isomerase [Candidatus Sungbacteria bacterium]
MKFRVYYSTFVNNEKIIVANWKCNPSTSREAHNLLLAIQKTVLKRKHVEMVICPPDIFLSALKHRVPCITFGVQDVFWNKRALIRARGVSGA